MDHYFQKIESNMADPPKIWKEKNREYRKMRRLYGVNGERTQMAKIRSLQMKDDTQRLICRTLYDTT